MLGALRSGGEISDRPEVSPFRILTDRDAFASIATRSDGFAGNSLATATNAPLLPKIEPPGLRRAGATNFVN